MMVFISESIERYIQQIIYLNLDFIKGETSLV